MAAEHVIEFGPLALCLVLMAGFSAWVFMHSRKSYLLRWTLIPAAVLVAVMSSSMYDARLGYAVVGQLPDKFVYLGHHVVVVNTHKVGIEVWARTRSTRLYRIPYSKAAEQSMEQAKAGTQRGPVVMHKSKKGEGKPGQEGGDETEPYKSNVMLPSDIDPKN